jgi:hypothetical protein
VVYMSEPTLMASKIKIITVILLTKSIHLSKLMNWLFAKVAICEMKINLLMWVETQMSMLG